MNAQDCDVCLEGYDIDFHRPRSLSCGHSVCSSCLQGLLASGMLTCPTCRAPHSTQVFSVDDIPVNFGLLSLLQERSHVICSLKRKSTGTLKAKIFEFEQQKKSLNDRLGAIETHIAINEEVTKNMTKVLSDLKGIREDLRREREYVEEALKEVVAQHAALIEVQHELNDATTIMEVTAAYDNVADSCNIAQSTYQHNQFLLSRDVKAKAEEIHAKCQDFMKEMQEMAACSGTPPMPPRPPVQKSRIQKEIDLVTLDRLEEALKTGSVQAVTAGENGPQHAEISLLGRHLLLHVLQDGVPSDTATLVQYERICSFQGIPIRTFLELSWAGQVRGKIFIQISGTGDRPLQFQHLCMGDRGPSYAGTNLLDLVEWTSDGDGLESWLRCGDYEKNDGSGGQSLPGMKDDDGPEIPVTPGLVRSSWIGGGRAAQFAIATSRHTTGGTTRRSIGEVMEGLHLVNTAASLNNIKEARVTDCGLVLRW